MNHDTVAVSRTFWTLYEPVHAVTYFNDAARAAYVEGGLRGFWRGYFAGRAAPLGRVTAPVVTAVFFGFAPDMVSRAIPSVWDLVSPERALELRLAGARAALGPLLNGLDAEVAVAAELLTEAAAATEGAGRVLSSANAALPVPDDAVGALWQAATVLRENRGDGHLAALVGAGLDGREALVLRCGIDLKRTDLQPVRGWTDAEWDAAEEKLIVRGWLEISGQATAAGRAGLLAVEDATDRAAIRPWELLGRAGLERLATALVPVAQACSAAMPYPSPIGVPPPTMVPMEPSAPDL